MLLTIAHRLSSFIITHLCGNVKKNLFGTRVFALGEDSSPSRFVDSATLRLRFFVRVILSAVEIRAMRGSNGTKWRLGSRTKKFDSQQTIGLLCSLRMTQNGFRLECEPNSASLREH